MRGVYGVRSLAHDPFTLTASLTACAAELKPPLRAPDEILRLRNGFEPRGPRAQLRNVPDLSAGSWPARRYWLFDLLGAAMLPGCMGVLVTAVPPPKRVYASVYSQLMINVLGPPVG